MEKILGPFVVEEKYYKEARKGEISCIKYKVGRVSGLVTSCVGSIFQNTLLKERWKEREDEEENVSSSWMTLRKRENNGSYEKAQENVLWKWL